MPIDDESRDSWLAERKALFDRFGGLPEVTVQNTEWLYMLEQDTRHSLAIEGYFTSEEELEAVLSGKRSALEVTNYFRAAQTVYDQALQFYRDHELRLDLPLVRHIHSELFRNKDERRGLFRQSKIQILRAKVQPPEFDVESYVRSALGMMLSDLNTYPILTALARAHTLFESIHPFLDGNGRTGRILLNYLTIGLGYPPIIIKGIQAEERERYYQALEAADAGFHEGFPDDITDESLRERLNRGDFAPLRALLVEGLAPRLERLTALAVMNREGLMTLPELAAHLGVQEATLRKRIERGTLLSLKDAGRIYSHPALVLHGRPRLETSEAPTPNGVIDVSRTVSLASRPLLVTLPDGATLDAGAVAIGADGYLITPPTTPMVDQLLAYLETKPRVSMDTQSRHLGIGLAALCVRWGSYLATLLDTDAPLHPHLRTGKQADDIALIDESEMKRMDVEVSYAIARLARIYHERGFYEFDDILQRAYVHLPMPHRSVPLDYATSQAINVALAVYFIEYKELSHPITPIAPQSADRVIANILAVQGWQETVMKHIQSGHKPTFRLEPHQRRMLPRQSTQLLREVCSKFASLNFGFSTLFNEATMIGATADTKSLYWPETAQALANSRWGSLAAGWSLTDTSAPVRLHL